MAVLLLGFTATGRAFDYLPVSPAAKNSQT
jgi:hypothetical protein